MLIYTYSIYFHLFILVFRCEHMFVTRCAIIMTQSLSIQQPQIRTRGAGTHQLDALMHRHTEHWFHLTCYCAIFQSL